MKLYSFNNFELNKLSYNSVYCLNIIDGKYYDIKFNQYINKNFNIQDVLIFTDGILVTNKTAPILNNTSYHEHSQYNILEDMHDVSLNYCEECENIVKTDSSLCNNCITTKCRCLFC